MLVDTDLLGLLLSSTSVGLLAGLDGGEDLGVRFGTARGAAAIACRVAFSSLRVALVVRKETNYC